MKKYGNIIGIFLIIIGIIILLKDYFLEKRNKAIENMNFLLLENTKEVVNTSTPIDNLEENESNDEPIQNIETPTDETNYIPPTYYYIGRIEIPQINLNKGFLDINDKNNTIKKNVMVHKLSDYPDVVNGNFILIAHSGTAYISFFKNLYKLNINDLVYIYYNNYKYTYQINNIYNVLKTGNVSIKRDYDKTTLTLITCTKDDDNHQTVYISYLIEKVEI